MTRGRILVMPNAVAGPGAVPPRPTGGDCHIVMLGRMWPPKGLPELMEALMGRRPELRFKFIQENAAKLDEAEVDV